MVYSQSAECHDSKQPTDQHKRKLLKCLQLCAVRCDKPTRPMSGRCTRKQLPHGHRRTVVHSCCTKNMRRGSAGCSADMSTWRMLCAHVLRSAYLGKYPAHLQLRSHRGRQNSWSRVNRGPAHARAGVTCRTANVSYAHSPRPRQC